MATGRSAKRRRVGQDDGDDDDIAFADGDQWARAAASRRSAKKAKHSPATPTSMRTTARATAATAPATPSPKQVDEKRLRKFRPHPPSSFLAKLHRASTQRMVVLSRRRRHDLEHPSEHIDIVGTTGNVYTVTIDHIPTCSCPDARKGNECKHKVYALRTVLKAPASLQYQLALLTSELDEIFRHAPPLPSELANHSGGADAARGNRKSTEDAECPICYMALEPQTNELVWCKAQCGLNVHKSCFNQWAAASQQSQLRCVYCRAPWDMDVTDSADVSALLKQGVVGEDGYINVADQLGLSRTRDTSSYYKWRRWEA